MEKIEEDKWIVNFDELFSNDLIESGDIIAFRGTTWKERLEKNDNNDNYYHVGIIYYPEKDQKLFFHLKNKYIDINNIEDLTSFIIIKTGIKWKNQFDNLFKQLTKNPKLIKCSKINSILAIFKKNNKNNKLFSSTFVAGFLNSSGYKLNLVGLTPTRLVEVLVNFLGRKVIEVNNV
jgi:hypothetical protein